MRPANRRFTLLDAMILLVGFAIGISFIILYGKINNYIQDGTFPNNYGFYALLDDWSGFRIVKTSLLLPVLMIEALAPALLLLRLFRPRPRFPRLLCQPGATACLATFVVMACRGVAMIIRVASGGDYSLRGGFIDFSADLQKTVPYAVATAWLLLALGRRWCPEPSWIDRVGRLIGAFWIFLLPWFWIADYCIGNGAE
jgi:hypothetical protein